MRNSVLSQREAITYGYLSSSGSSLSSNIQKCPSLREVAINTILKWLSLWSSSWAPLQCVSVTRSCHRPVLQETRLNTNTAYARRMTPYAEKGGWRSLAVLQTYNNTPSSKLNNAISATYSIDLFISEIPILWPGLKLEAVSETGKKAAEEAQRSNTSGCRRAKVTFKLFWNVRWKPEAEITKLLSTENAKWLCVRENEKYFYLFMRRKKSDYGPVA